MNVKLNCCGILILLENSCKIKEVLAQKNLSRSANLSIVYCL